MEYVITPNNKLNRFEILLEDGSYAFLTYHFHKGHMAILHTEVPPKYNGQGIAGKLAKEALEYARRNQLKVKVYCPFVKSWMVKHAEYNDLLLEQTGTE
jgi:predicted GNAT family acetyltransferase